MAIAERNLRLSQERFDVLAEHRNQQEARIVELENALTKLATEVAYPTKDTSVIQAGAKAALEWLDETDSE